MVKIGNLRDFQNAIKKLKAAGHDPLIEKSPNDLTRRVLVSGVEVLSMARISGNTWSFIYNDSVWTEKEVKK